jgi:hypothetical protein
MDSRVIHQCQCSECEIGNVTIRQHHEHLNLLMSRLDEQQRRWMAAMEAKKLGHGGIRQLQKITGLDINTIRRGQKELLENLESRPVGRIRASGGGRKPVEKKSRDCGTN